MIELLNQYGQAWAEFFGLAVLQNTLFLGIVFLVLFWLRNATARTRYAIAMIGIIKLLLPPFMPASLLSKWFAFPGETIAIQIGKPMAAASAETMEPTLSVSLIGLLFFVWFVTLSISLIIPAFAMFRLKLRLKNARLIQSEDLDNFSGKVYQSEKITMPMTIGFFSNKIFVPARWDSWPAECRKMILHHEIAHIKRKDGIFQLIQIVAQAIYFFHPLVWILNSRINQYREMACDDASVATKRNSSMEYSRYLVKIAEEMTLSELGYTSASALIRQRNELLNRVQYQIMEVAMKHISTKKLGAILTILLLSFSLLSFTLNSSPPLDDPGYFAVQEKAKIIGTIKDGKTGKPIQGAEVRIEGMDLAAVSDADGNYVIAIADFTPGTYKIKTSILGYKFVHVAAVKVEENITTRLDFTLEPTGGLTLVEKINLKQKLQKGEEISPPPKENLQKGVEIPQLPEEKLVTIKEKQQGKEKLVTIEEKQHGKEKSFTIKEKQPGEIPPPPPPPPVSDKATFADFDTPPEVVGGFGELAKAIKYPESARKAGTTGTVHVGVQIDERGKVLETKILESLTADCDQAAVDALKSVNWKPAIKDKKPVKVWVTVPVKFNLK
ncbi:MAG TPA: TonB family protein [bacterium]